MATVKDVLDLTRINLDDTGCKKFSDYELISYLNSAMDFLSMELVAQRDDTMIRNISFTDGLVLPDFFIEFAGQYPIHLEGNIAKCSKPMDARCWSKFDYIENLADPVPFRPMYMTVVAQLTALYALAKSNGGIPQNQQSMEYIRNNIALIRDHKQVASHLPAVTD